MFCRVTFPLPPTLNEQINEARTHWAKSATTKKKWTSKIARLSAPLPKFQNEVWLEFWYSINNFGRDPDNISASRKYLMDGLVAAGVIRDDNLTIIQSPILEWFVPGEVDQVTITISDRPIIEVCKRRATSSVMNP